MSKRLLATAFVLSLATLPAAAQYTLNVGDNSLEIGGRISGFYNYRFVKPSEDNYKKDRFGLRDLQLHLEGRNGNKWEYSLQVDFADLATNSSAGTVIDPENPGLMDAYISYIALPVHIKFGYDKLPYSQGSMNDVYGTPFWSRGTLTDGSLFTRRDLGLTLSSSLWKQRVNIYGGVYTGLGENIIANGDNDASGRPEFIGRVDVAYPSRFRYNEIDEVSVPIPLFRVGVNARYTNKTQPAGSTLPTTLGSDYGLRIIDGERWVYGADATFAYKGFSAQFEYQQISARPSQQSNPLYSATSADINKGKVMAGGYLAQVNYSAKSLHSVLSARYENVNLNDLVYGKSEWLNLAYAYTINSFRNVIKVQYYHALTEDTKSDPLKYLDQIRVGWQHLF